MGKIKWQSIEKKKETSNSIHFFLQNVLIDLFNGV